MATSNLTLDIGPLRLEPRAHRVLHNAFEIAVVSSVVPRTVLVDQDSGFVKAATRIAKRFQIPFQSFVSLSDMELHRRPVYDLVLLDEKTVGRDHLIDTAMKMTNMSGDVAVVLIGDEEPSEDEMEAWSPLIQRFLFKDWDSEGVEVLFRDAMQIFANSQVAGNRRVKYLGG
jgi:DNA-binding NtrC family response regulator